MHILSPTTTLRLKFKNKVRPILPPGSDINLTKSPDSIKPFLTHSLSLRCSLSDSVWQVLTTSPSPLVIGKRGQQGSDDNIRFVTSLVVSRDGQDVASVSDYVPAKAVSGENNLQVQGAVSKTAGERGCV